MSLNPFPAVYCLLHACPQQNYHRDKSEMLIQTCSIYYLSLVYELMQLSWNVFNGFTVLHIVPLVVETVTKNFINSVCFWRVTATGRNT